jgi:hypothetical protein
MCDAERKRQDRSQEIEKPQGSHVQA